MHARQIGIEQQQPLERRYRRFVVAQARRDIGIGKYRRQVRRVAQHLLEQRVLLRDERGRVVRGLGRCD